MAWRGDYFGNSVSISGNTVVVGAPLGVNGDQGAAYVFTEPALGWKDNTETAELTASDGAGADYFGTSVSISGNTVVVGAYGVNGSQGAAYVFTESGSGWVSTSMAAKLTASDGASGDTFGYSVSISGNTVVVGAYSATVNGNSNAGAAYVFATPPTVTLIGPSQGPLGGGTSVTITGTNLDNATEVYFGATPVTTFTSDTDNQIVLNSPAGNAGTVDVTVVTAGGASASSSADLFTYVAAPTVASISPAAGPLAGGTPVIITGTNLAGATEVYFGATLVTTFFTNSFGTQIALNSPGAAIVGPVDVTVVTAGGTSATSLADKFSYVAAPTVMTSPTNAKTDAGLATAVTFTAAASGTPTPTVKWQVNTGSGFTDLSNGGVYGGVTTTTLTVTGATLAMNGYQYQAVFTNGTPPDATTTPATLTVNPALGIAPTTLPTTVINVLYDQTITVSGGTTPYTTFAVSGFSAGGTGLTSGEITANASAGTIVVNGTPTAPGFGFLHGERHRHCWGDAQPELYDHGQPTAGGDDQPDQRDDGCRPGDGGDVHGGGLWNPDSHGEVAGEHAARDSPI